MRGGENVCVHNCVIDKTERQTDRQTDRQNFLINVTRQYTVIWSETVGLG